MASIYQANLVIEIPNMTENYVNWHVFTCRHWVSAMLIKIFVTLLGSFLIGQIFFYSGGLGANRNVSGKLGMKLAICIVCDQGALLIPAKKNWKKSPLKWSNTWVDGAFKTQI